MTEKHTEFLLQLRLVDLLILAQIALAWTNPSICGKVIIQPNQFGYKMTETANDDLVEAILNKNRERVRSAIKRGADPSLRIGGSVPVLFLAAGMGNLGTVRELVEHGADIHAKDFRKSTLLTHIVPFARSPQHFTVMKYLIDAGSDLDLIDERGQSPLKEALLYQNDAAAKLFIESGAYINHTTETNPVYLRLTESSGQGRS